MAKITNHDIARMRELSITGHTAAEIASMLNCAPATVRYWSERSGIAINRHRTPVDQMTAADVLELASLGLSRTQIAKRLGMSARRVRWTAQRFEIPLASGVTGRPRKSGPTLAGAI